MGSAFSHRPTLCDFKYSIILLFKYLNILSFFFFFRIKQNLFHNQKLEQLILLICYLS